MDSPKAAVISYFRMLARQKTLRYVAFIVSAVFLFHHSNVGLDLPLLESSLAENSAAVRCDTVHVAVACVGSKGSRMLSTLVKSLLFYRTTPLHLHLITDSTAEFILKHLFQTWSIPQMETTFYNFNYISTLPELQNIDGTDVRRFWKLNLLRIIPTSERRVIAMDVDSILDGDVVELWSYFSSMRSDEAIAIAERNDNPIEGSDRYDAGIVLLDLEKLRILDWDNIWTRHLQTLNEKSGHVSENALFSSVLTGEPQLAHVLPCEWSVQRANVEACYRNVPKLKLIHGIKDFGKETGTEFEEIFRNMASTLSGMDGNILRRELFYCADPKQTAVTTQVSHDPCHEIKSAAHIRFRTHLFYMGYQEKSENPHDVTWVSQLSLDRMHMIEALCQLWEGPISLAFYLTDNDVEKLVSFVQTSSVLSKRRNIGYHVVYKQGRMHPINYLRNVALDNVVTPFVFLSDIDFVPNPKLYPTLQNYVQQMNLSTGKKALVVPAFETLQRDFRVPASKAELIKKWNAKNVFTFKYHSWKRGHAPTNYNRWKLADKPYEIKWQKDYEPYFVVRSDVVRYDLRFSGYFWNKVSHCVELDAQGYKYYVLPNTYIVHLVHANSADMSRFRSSPKHKRCYNKLQADFLSDMKKRYHYKMTGKH